MPRRAPAAALAVGTTLVALAVAGTVVTGDGAAAATPRRIVWSPTTTKAKVTTTTRASTTTTRATTTTTRATTTTRPATTSTAPLVTTTTITAASPGLPRSATALPVGTVVLDTQKTGNFELYSTVDGKSLRALTTDTRYDSWWPRLSPDRRTIVFQRTPVGVHDRDYTKVELWAVAATGGTPVRLRSVGQDGWFHQGHVDWSPDGTRLTMFGGTQISPQIFVTDASGRNPQAVTNRPGANLDPTFAPDGRSIAFIGCPQATCYPEDYEVYVTTLEGSASRRLTFDRYRDHDPVISPDGSRVAWISQLSTTAPMGEWRLMVASAADGSGARRVYGAALDPVGAPRWETGSTVLVHRLVGSWPGFNVYRTNVDTGASTLVTTEYRGSYEYPDS